MKIIWDIENSDVDRVTRFFEAHRDNYFVKQRIERNLGRGKAVVSLDSFWEVMVGCLLTSQQKSGPGNPVNRFITSRPHPLAYSVCSSQTDVAEFASEVLRQFGGIRRFTIIAKELETNLSFLNQNGWARTTEVIETVRRDCRPETERQAADFIADHFKGFGPKQSRNLLQWLGISRHEIPIDSRIVGWLNRFGFPVKLTARMLSDRDYYAFVSDGFQKLCEACSIVPCILDAAIFSSYDKGKWNSENYTYG